MFYDNDFVGMEALRKVLHQSRLLFSNGYDKVFLKAGGYRQAITDFKSVDPKLLQDSIQTVSHYANTPMQYTAIFHGRKNDNFQMKFV